MNRTATVVESPDGFHARPLQARRDESRRARRPIIVEAAQDRRQREPGQRRGDAESEHKLEGREASRFERWSH